MTPKTSPLSASFSTPQRVARWRFGNGMRCPSGVEGHRVGVDRRERWACAAAGCAHAGTLRKGTSFEGTRVCWPTIAAAVELLVRTPDGPSTAALSDELGLHHRTTERLRCRLALVMGEALGRTPDPPHAGVLVHARRDLGFGGLSVLVQVGLGESGWARIEPVTEDLQLPLEKTRSQRRGLGGRSYGRLLGGGWMWLAYRRRGEDVPELLRRLKVYGRRGTDRPGQAEARGRLDHLLQRWRTWMRTAHRGAYHPPSAPFHMAEFGYRYTRYEWRWADGIRTDSEDLAREILTAALSNPWHV